MNETKIFDEALDIPNPADRAAYLARACAGDEALRQRVLALLKSHEEAGSFLMPPPGGSEFATLDGNAGVDGSPPRRPSRPVWENPLAEKPGAVIGQYKLLQQIGEGGFGIVWMADQEKPVRRRVALKIIKMGMDTKEVIARFEQERQALAMMDHPNIARVLDAGATQTGRPYFVMELVRGVKITEYCDEQGLSTVERIELFITVCQAVQHAHQKGIIHRDLKPSNILVTINDGEAVPKVIDFGVAKATQGRITDGTLFTQFEQMIGTPLYMSPEQAEITSLDVDTRSDIYSLGVLLYELLTGRTPIDTATMARAGMDEVRRLIREVDPPRPSARIKTLDGNELTSMAKRRHTDVAKLPGALRGDIDWIVMKCLEKDRKRRYDTANGLAVDLQRHLKNDVVMARPPTTAYLLSKLIRRNRLAFVASAAIAASLFIGVMASVWQAVRAKAAERQVMATLDELRAGAPAFAAQARALADRQQYDEAIGKLDYAAKLRPDAAEYLITKADLLQCQLRFDEAASNYRAALRLVPDDTRAQANAALCDKLQAERAAQPKLSRESLTQLFAAMTAEHRSAAELLTVGRMVDETKKLILDYWIARLKDLPVPPTVPIGKRLTMADDGNLALDLSDTPIADLSPLEGMPLVSLNLSGCKAVTDFRPLSALPLRTLILNDTKIADLAPLAKLRLLKTLDLSSPQVRDLTLLQGLPLRILNIRNTLVSDLKPLAGMALEEFDGTSIPAVDFSALAGMPLATLTLTHTRVGDLSFLSGMPLKTLLLHHCALARGFGVLRELKSLEVLVLPQTVMDLPKEEIQAISLLRHDLALRQIEIGNGFLVDGTSLAAGSLGEFWKKWDGEVFIRDLGERADIAETSGHLDEAVARWSEAAELFPNNSWIPLHIATMQLWLGKTEGYAETCRRFLNQAEESTQAEAGDRAVKAFCLRPSTDQAAIGQALRMARKILKTGKGDIEPVNGMEYEPYYQLSLGMAEYRSRHFAEADAALLIAEKSVKNRDVYVSAKFFHAMSLVRQGQPGAARKLFAEAEANMEPLPADENQPFARGARNTHDTIIQWLAFKEAKALLASDEKATGETRRP